MRASRIREHLLPGAAELDPGFRDEIQRAAHLGLRVIGGVMIGVSLFMILARFVVAPDPATLEMRLVEAAIVIGLGIVMLALARVRAAYPHARLIGLLSGFVVTMVTTWFSLCLCDAGVQADNYIPGQMTLTMLVAVAAVPVRPLHTLALGASLGIGYYLMATLAVGYLPTDGPQPAFLLFIVMLTLLAAGMTAVVYHQRHASYRSYTQALQAGEQLRQAQAKMLLSENAASLGRLAAALSHELNSPIGALQSGVDTLLLLSGRLAALGGSDDHKRIVRVQSDLRKSIQQSVDRLRQIVARMQRITNLDKAEVQEVNLNEMLLDVAAMLGPRTNESARLEWDLEPLPPLVCRPQQLSAVFSNLLANSLGALNGDGVIRIASRVKGVDVEVEIRDSGKGVPPAELANIFDPGFKVADGRVATGNWSMFSSRQVVREHGGEIRIESRVGEGTTVWVTLPVGAVPVT